MYQNLSIRRDFCAVDCALGWLEQMFVYDALIDRLKGRIASTGFPSKVDSRWPLTPCRVCEEPLEELASCFVQMELIDILPGVLFGGYLCGKEACTQSLRARLRTYVIKYIPEYVPSSSGAALSEIIDLQSSDEEILKGIAWG